MNRMTLAFITASMLLAAAPLVGATHDAQSQKRADCENADNQGWIGYHSSRTARQLYENASKTAPFNSAVVDNCEGEHWDGQDSVNNDAQNEPTTTSETQCAPKVSESATGDFSVTQCQRADINEGGDGPLGRTPLALRLSGKGSGDGKYQEVYVGTDIMLVGRAAVYAGTCSDGTQGLEGAAQCDSQSTAHGRQARTGAYVRDNTPGNVLAVIVSSAGITRGEAGEGDCSQERYYQGVEENRRDLCTRDNTAITAEALLP